MAADGRWPHRDILAKSRSAGYRWPGFLGEGQSAIEARSGRLRKQPLRRVVALDETFMALEEHQLSVGIAVSPIVTRHNRCRIGYVSKVRRPKVDLALSHKFTGVALIDIRCVSVDDSK